MLNFENSKKLSDYKITNNYNGLLRVKENEQLLFFEMKSKDSPQLTYSVYYSKLTGNTISGYVFFVENEQFFGLLKTGYGSWIVSELPIDYLLNWKEEIMKKKTIPTHDFIKTKLELVDELTEDDNPILMFYNLKPF
jgi:hypothetical protein